MKTINLIFTLYLNFKTLESSKKNHLTYNVGTIDNTSTKLGKLFPYIQE